MGIIKKDLGYEVQLGINLKHWEGNKGQVYGSKKNLMIVEEAKEEAESIYQSCVVEDFKDDIIMRSEWQMIPSDVKAWYEQDPTKLVVARMDGKINGDNEGEFYILILKKTQEESNE